MSLVSKDEPAVEEQPKSTPAATPAPSDTLPSAAKPAAATPAATPSATPAAPAAAPAQGATPAQAAPAQPAQPAAAAPAAAQPAQPEPAAGAPQTLDQIRNKNIADLEEKVFNLDPKVLDEWDLDKGKMAKDLSNLAARISIVTMESVIHSVAQQFPGWLQNYSQTQRAQDEIKSEFLGAFPGLKDHMDKVEPIAVAYRAANPKATRADAIKAVGEIVHVTYGIPKPGAPVAPSASARTPLPPMQLAGSHTPRVAPAASPAPTNAFTALAEEFAQHDD